MQPLNRPFQREEHFYTQRFIFRPHLQPAGSGAQRPECLFIGDTGFKRKRAVRTVLTK